MTWNESQLNVIQSRPESRLLVDAGPGTGKTAVACGRISHLIEKHDIEPSNIWMVSFTRTAVAEIRARIFSYLNNRSYGIKVATLDSHAWSILSGYDPAAQLTASYEENIQRTIDLLEHDADAAEELLRIEHFIIDEAQDLVGSRADLALKMIEKLSPKCGTTIFSDEAQAIYGFSNDYGGNGRDAANDNLSLARRILSQENSGVDKAALSGVHRTSDPNLVNIFQDLRETLVREENHDAGVYSQIAEGIRNNAHRNDLNSCNLQIEEFSQDDLLLFRTRCEVLQAAQFCKVPIQLRLSGYGLNLPAWIGICFWDFEDRFIGKDAFFNIWASRIENNTATEHGPEEAWNKLSRLGSHSAESLDMRLLRRRLSQPKLPVDVSLPDYGLQGPIVGTIHASKGREADNAIVLLPTIRTFNSIESEVEESKVLFVGATRARESLSVGSSLSLQFSVLPSGRIYRRTQNSNSISVMVETGISGDVTPVGLVGRCTGDQHETKSAQEFLRSAADIVTLYRLQADPDSDWCFRLFPPQSDRSVATLSKNLTSDLWTILRKLQRNYSHRPPFNVNYVRGLGCSTVVLGSDDPEIGALHEPWASSGFLLAPRIAAFPLYYFTRRNSFP